MPRGRARGFTLIELLMVVAIIALLSTIVLGAMRTARLSGLDAAIREQAGQLRTTLELERSDSGTYTAVKNGGAWRGPGETCSGFTGNHATKAKEICDSLLNSMQGCDDCLFFRTTNPNSATAYSIMAYLPGESASAGTATYLCIGSSGAQSESPADWALPGCWTNP